MNIQSVNINKIAWRELFPWSIIFRTLPIATSVTVIVLATAGVMLIPLGWFAGEQVFLTKAIKANDPALAELARINRSPYLAVFRASEPADRSVRILGANLNGPWAVFENTVRPFRALFQTGWSTREYIYLVLGSLWSILVWSFLGCAITRACVIRLTRDESLGIADAFDFALMKYRDCLGAVLMPLSGVALLCIPLGLLGLLLGFDVGVFLVGIFWFVILAGAAVIAFLLFGLLFGWPLIVASISTEGQNSFDAVTRAFAYTFQRPLNYALYMLVAILFGGFCWLIVSVVTDKVVDLGYWATSWGANRISIDRIEVVKGSVNPFASSVTDNRGFDSPLPGVDAEQQSVSSALRRGRQIIGFWNGCVRTVAAAFLHGLFWCMAGAIYLLLRKDVDETEMDEVFLVDEKKTYDLPPLKSDENGIPQVLEPVAVGEMSADATGDSES
jgi:hypothetical protein